MALEGQCDLSKKPDPHTNATFDPPYSNLIDVLRADIIKGTTSAYFHPGVVYMRPLSSLPVPPAAIVQRSFCGQDRSHNLHSAHVSGHPWGTRSGFEAANGLSGLGEMASRLATSHSHSKTLQTKLRLADIFLHPEHPCCILYRT